MLMARRPFAIEAAEQQVICASPRVNGFAQLVDGRSVDWSPEFVLGSSAATRAPCSDREAAAFSFSAPPPASEPDQSGRGRGTDSRRSKQLSPPEIPAVDDPRTVSSASATTNDVSCAARGRQRLCNWVVVVTRAPGRASPASISGGADCRHMNRRRSPSLMMPASRPVASAHTCQAPLDICQSRRASACRSDARGVGALSASVVPPASAVARFRQDGSWQRSSY